MPQDRRSFIKRFGATLGSMIVSGSLSGCGPQKHAGSLESQAASQNEPSPGSQAPEWEQLRQCWFNLKDTDGIEKARAGRIQFTATKDTLAKEHQVVLDALVAKGQLKGPVAEHMQLAFEEAAYHVVRSMATCYLGLPIEYAPREDLLKQADVLRTISGDLDPATVAKAQAAIAQDVAFFEVFKTGKYDYLPLRDQYRASGLQASPEALEAARLLTRLFAGTSN